MAEYRLDELARISGVSARNIRAYRERGLLDAPRRVGRSAYYDDYHLSQLRTISQLLRRGFNSAHIAEFFTSMREGADLADILGIQQAVLGPRSDRGNGSTGAPRRAIDIEPDSDEARALAEYGLTDMIDGAVVPADPRIAEIIGRTSDPLLYVRALLQAHEATQDAVDGLADGYVRVLKECVAARFGSDSVPEPRHTDELSRIISDYRELWSVVFSDRLDRAVQQRMAATMVVVTGQPEPDGK